MGYPIVELQEKSGIPFSLDLDSGSATASLSAPIFKNTNLRKVYKDTVKVSGAAGFEEYESRVAPQALLYLGNFLLEV